MIIDHPAPAQIPALRSLWQDTFDDEDAFLDNFFATAFCPARSLCAMEQGEVIGAVYWFDCTCGGDQLAYLYALAVQRAYRAQGIGTKLLEKAHGLLESRDYAGVLLVPQQAQLVRWYEKHSYRACTSLREFSVQCGTAAVPLRPVSAQEYAKLRHRYLPAGAVVQEGENLAFLQTQAAFYAGADFILAARQNNGTLFALELLGNAAAAPEILSALQCPAGSFRIPGQERPFAMFRPLGKTGCPRPSYFAFAFD